MKKYILISVVFLLCSCKLFKGVSKSSNETKATEEVTTQTKRKGDTVTYIVPRIKYKDTTVTTVNRVGTVLQTRYNSQGNVDLVNCMTSQIDELKREIRTLSENNTEKQKQESAKSDPITWGLVIAGLVILVGIVAGILLKLKKN